MTIVWFASILGPAISTHCPALQYTASSRLAGGVVSQLQSPAYAQPVLLLASVVVLVDVAK